MKTSITTINYNELPQLYEMLWRSYEYHFKHSPKDFFVPFVERFPFFNNESFFVIKEKNKIISAMQVLLLNTYINKKQILLGGIGQVATLPEYRGKGLASKLLTETIKYMKSKNVIYSLLFAGPVLLYKKYGWKEIPIKYVIANVDKYYVKLKDSEVIPYTKFFRYDIYHIHNEYIKNFNNCIIRNPLYWENYFWKFKAKKTKIYMLKFKKEIVSYIAVKKEKKILSIFEYASLIPDNKKYFLVLLKYIIDKYSINKVFIPYSNKHYLPGKILRDLFKGEEKIKEGVMIKNINDNLNMAKFIDKALFFLGDSF